MKIWREYLAYLKDNPEGYWFKRKLYGWGWTPAKPAGWAVVVGYIAVVLGLALYTEAQRTIETNPEQFVVLFAVVTVLFLVITWKTGEPPQWQWGIPHQDKRKEEHEEYKENREQ